VHVDERANDDESTKDAPQPESAGIETISQIAPLQLSTYAIAEAMRPNNGKYAQGDGRKQEEDKAVVHSVSAIMPGGDGVDVCRDNRPKDYGVYAKGHY